MLTLSTGQKQMLLGRIEPILTEIVSNVTIDQWQLYWQAIFDEEIYQRHQAQLEELKVLKGITRIREIIFNFSEEASKNNIDTKKAIIFYLQELANERLLSLRSMEKIAQKPDSLAETKHFFDVLDKAILSGDISSLLQLLRDFGVNLREITDPRGNTLLHRACERPYFTDEEYEYYSTHPERWESQQDNRIKAIKILFGHGAHLAQRNKFGLTPLLQMFSANGVRSLRVFKMLKEHGANIEDRDSSNKNLLHLIFEASFNVAPLFEHLLTTCDVISFLRYIPNNLDMNGNTALHILCQKKLPNASRFLKDFIRLIEVKAASSEEMTFMLAPTNNNKETPLFLAVMSLDEEMVKLLTVKLKGVRYQRNLVIDYQNLMGYTALSFIASEYDKLFKLYQRTNNTASAKERLLKMEITLSIMQFIIKYLLQAKANPDLIPYGNPKITARLIIKEIPALKGLLPKIERADEKFEAIIPAAAPAATSVTTNKAPLTMLFASSSLPTAQIQPTKVVEISPLIEICKYLLANTQNSQVVTLITDIIEETIDKANTADDVPESLRYLYSIYHSIKAKQGERTAKDALFIEVKQNGLVGAYLMHVLSAPQQATLQLSKKLEDIWLQSTSASKVSSLTIPL